MFLGRYTIVVNRSQFFGQLAATNVKVGPRSRPAQPSIEGGRKLERLVLGQYDVARQAGIIGENFQILDGIVGIAKQNNRECNEQDYQRTNPKPLTFAQGQIGVNGVCQGRVVRYQCIDMHYHMVTGLPRPAHDLHLDHEILLFRSTQLMCGGKLHGERRSTAHG